MYKLPMDSVGLITPVLSPWLTISELAESAAAPPKCLVMSSVPNIVMSQWHPVYPSPVKSRTVQGLSAESRSIRRELILEPPRLKTMCIG